MRNDAWVIIGLVALCIVGLFIIVFGLFAIANILLT